MDCSWVKSLLSTYNANLKHHLPCLSPEQAKLNQWHYSGSRIQFQEQSSSIFSPISCSLKVRLFGKRSQLKIIKNVYWQLMVWRDFPSTQTIQELGYSFYMEDKTFRHDSKRTGTKNTACSKLQSRPTATYMLFQNALLLISTI